MALTATPFDGGGCGGIARSPTLALFAAAGSNGDGTILVATSPDGQCWTPRVSPLGFNNGSSMHWSPDLGQFLMTGRAGFNTIATSTDGITWTTRPDPFDGGRATRAAWSPALGLWACGGQSSSPVLGGHTICTSPDGVNWTARVTPFDSSVGGPVAASCEDITWSPDLGLFVAVGVTDSTATTTVLATSPDGITWTAQTTPLDGVLSLTFVTWSSLIGLFVAGAFGLGTIESADGVTWTLQTFTDSTNVGFANAIDPLGLLVATGLFAFGSSSLMTSPDGATWTTQTTAGPAGIVIWAPDLSFAIATQATAFQTSPDLVTWTQNSCAATGPPVFHTRFPAAPPAGASGPAGPNPCFATRFAAGPNAGATGAPGPTPVFGGRFRAGA